MKSSILAEYTITPPGGFFVISLDFELAWGVHPGRVACYRSNLLGARAAVPRILETFAEYGIHATWAIVGLLFFRTRDELLGALPVRKPAYADSSLSPYSQLAYLGRSEDDDPVHFAPSLIREIMSCPGQEVASHTFSHYYCLEPGQDIATFEEDLGAAARSAALHGLKLRSIVFPRNQVCDAYLPVCRQMGIEVYRGCTRHWFHQPVARRSNTLPRRAMRLLDTYTSLAGHNSYSAAAIPRTVPLNVPASQFLRPFLKRAGALEELRLRRILTELETAATRGGVYHLWWHPHNFGLDVSGNLAFLRRILDRFSELRDARAMESLGMAELAERMVIKAR